MTTKRQIIDLLFSEMALAGYAFDVSPEEQQDAASKLEAMIAGWSVDDVRLPFNFSADPTSIDLDADSGVPLVHLRTVYAGGAIAFAAGMGKNVAPQTTKAFNDGYSRLLRAATFPQEQALPSTLPRGAGPRSALIQPSRSARCWPGYRSN